MIILEGCFVHIFDESSNSEAF